MDEVEPEVIAHDLSPALRLWPAFERESEIDAEVRLLLFGC